MTDKKIISMFDDAIEGKLSLEDLDSRWSSIDSESPFYEMLYNDLHDAVTHIPNGFFNKNVDWEVWIKQYEYGVLIYDRLMFPHSSIGEEKWIRIRIETLKSAKDYTEESIKIQLKHYFP